MAFTLQIARSLFQAAPTLLAPFRQNVLSTAVRSFASRQDCVQAKNPRCSKENLTKTPCAQNRKAFDRTEIKKPTVKPMWENPECCLDPCMDVFPRFDDLYYKPSDKAKRVYQQTWIECPQRKIVQKIRCDFEKLELPPIIRRPRKEHPKTACSGANDCDLMKCLKKAGNLKCVKISLPGCRQVRNPPRCKRARYKLDCQKICCPYPSFSECTKPKPKPKHPVECTCLNLVSLCDVHDMLRRTWRKHSNGGSPF